MLNKKNIAMVMAATTFLGSAAPALAAFEKEVVDEATLIDKVEGLLNTKYSNPAESGNGQEIVTGEEHLNSVYQITVGTVGGTVVKNVEQLKALIENAKVNATALSLCVVDKGHKEVNGNIVANETNKFAKYVNGADLEAKITAANTHLTNAGASTTVVYYDNNNNVLTSSYTNAYKAVITLANETKLEIFADDYKVDFSKPVDANGNVIVTSGASSAVKKSIVGFKIDDSRGTEEKIDLPAKELTKLVFNVNAEKLEEQLTDLYNETKYTAKGAELVNTVVDAKGVGTGNLLEVSKDGKTYQIEAMSNTDISDIAVTDDGYKLTVKMIVNEKNSYVKKTVSISVVSDNQEELKLYRDALVGASIVQEGAARFDIVVGKDRFKTAIEVSKKAYTTNNSAGAVVLVGQDAVVDGLAAAPLAAQKNAPILLSNKDMVDADTMAEIKRVLPATGVKTVYVVGGEDTISTEVEEQLVNELNVTIVRLAGGDRYDTSLKIAKELTIGTGANQKAFVVGGDGLADAMSVAAVASNGLYTDASKATPIIVTPEAGLTDDAKIFLDKYTNITNVDVIGGTSKVSSDVLSDIKDLNKTVTRVAGDDRQETNAKVIDRYYLNAGTTDATKIKLDQTYTSGTASTINDIFVAQDGYVGGDSKLIDALTVAPLAGKLDAPIVLATNNLSLKQQQVIDAKTDTHDGTSAGDTYNKLTKIGGGVSTSPIRTLLDILGL